MFRRLTLIRADDATRRRITDQIASIRSGPLVSHLQSGRELCDESDDLVILHVIISVLHQVPSENLEATWATTEAQNQQQIVVGMHAETIDCTGPPKADVQKTNYCNFTLSCTR